MLCKPIDYVECECKSRHANIRPDFFNILKSRGLALYMLTTTNSEKKSFQLLFSSQDCTYAARRLCVNRL